MSILTTGEVGRWGGMALGKGEAPGREHSSWAEAQKPWDMMAPVGTAQYCPCRNCSLVSFIFPAVHRAAKAEVHAPYSEEESHRNQPPHSVRPPGGVFLLLLIIIPSMLLIVLNRKTFTWLKIYVCILYSKSLPPALSPSTLFSPCHNSL